MRLKYEDDVNITRKTRTQMGTCNCKKQRRVSQITEEHNNNLNNFNKMVDHITNPMEFTMINTGNRNNQSIEHGKGGSL